MNRNIGIRLSGVILFVLMSAVSAFAQDRAAFGQDRGDTSIVQDGVDTQHGERGGRCDLRSLRGSYGYTMVGGVNDGSDRTLHTHATFAGFGRIVFNGRGGHSGVEVVNLASHFINRSYVGTYTVNADCTGILRRVEIPASNAVVRFVIVDDGKQVFFMQIDNPDAAIQGTAVKQ
jgi:hypothetical protein